MVKLTFVNVRCDKKGCLFSIKTTFFLLWHPSIYCLVKLQMILSAAPQPDRVFRPVRVKPILHR
jgi:hypothetical protein